MNKEGKLIVIFIVLILVFNVESLCLAEENDNNDLNMIEQNIEEVQDVINYDLNTENTMYWENTVNTGRDNGFSKTNVIKNGDPHYGWSLGKFALSGFTGKRKDENDNWVFLKNAGDNIILSFNLQQSIDSLDGDTKLYIGEDKNGYDNEFGIKKTNFGKGCLIIRKTDATGNKNDPVIYQNYLTGIEVGANTKIDVCEEGDYEVTLDYEVVKETGLIKSFNNYKIRFDFSIRNGNCMVYPCDVSTGNELMNTSITENGFYIDLAKSQYLDVIVKKEVLVEGSEGLVEDTRFNRPAKSGEQFTEEGIYTITATNNYTAETTIKKIYVGKDKILKAYVQTGKPIDVIKSMVNAGATIDDEGNIKNVPKEFKTTIKEKDIEKKEINYIPIVSVLLVLGVFVIGTVVKNKKNIKKEKNTYSSKEHEKYFKIGKSKYIHVFPDPQGYSYDIWDEKTNTIKTDELIATEEPLGLTQLKIELENKIKVDGKIKEISKEEYDNKIIEREKNEKDN